MATIGSMPVARRSARPEPGVAIHRAVRLWLIGLAGIVFAMVIVGGATRLTNSGLSITEWKPIVGIVPPLGDSDWQEAFARYKEIPQYKLLNRGMSLEAFKTIFWWEWGHRFLGRLIGIAFVVPFVYFLAKGMLPAALRIRLLAIFALGGLQGAIGWYMVKSGLVDRTDVSQYRLALHLFVAVIIFAALLWLADPLQQRRATATVVQHSDSTHRLFAGVIIALLLAQIVLGAFVAGMKAGLAHNTWPLMDAHLLPSGLLAMSPWWINAFENALTVQFNHRLMAYLVAIVVTWHAVQIMRDTRHAHLRTTAILVLAATLGQIGLGIWTLLAAVPIALGIAHQAGALILLGIAVLHARAATAPNR